MTGKAGRQAMRRAERLPLWLATLSVILVGVAAPANGVRAATVSSLPASFVTYPLSNPQGSVNAMRFAPDGRWWVTNFDGTPIDRMTLAGSDSPLAWDTPFPGRLTTGSDGNVWMTDSAGAGPVIDKVSPSGTVLARYPVPQVSSLSDVVLGPDGNVWFTDFQTGAIGRITPAGSIVVFQWPAGVGTDIAPGPDGNVWITDQVHGQVGRITPSGVITVFPVPPLDRQAAPDSMTTGPDGNLWYADPRGATIGRVTPSGNITQFVVPSGIQPLRIGAGPDGTLWFTDYFGSHVGRITTAGDVGVFDVSSAGSFPDNISAGPDGRLWLTLAHPAYLTLPHPASVAAFDPFTPTASAPDIRDVSTRYSLPSGGGQIVVTGYDAGSATQVLFGSTPATSFTSLGPSQLSVTVPPHAVGATDVTVVTPSGTSAPSPVTPPNLNLNTLGSTGSHFYYQATNCGTVITQSTMLSGDIGPCYTEGLSVDADNVTLDLNGYGVIGFQDPRDSTVVGINLPQRSRVTVQNGTVSGFDAGIHIGGGSGNTVARMSIHDNIGLDEPFNSRFGDGIMIEHGSSNNQIVHNVIDHNGIFDGIGVFDAASDGNTIAYNTVENTVGPSGHGPAGEGIIINGANGSAAATAIRSSVVEHNVVSNNGSGGIANVNEIGGQIKYNTVSGNGTTNSFGNGIGVQVGFNWTLGPTQMTIAHNQVSGNGVDGIRLGGPFGFFRGAAEGNTVSYNTATDNGANRAVDIYEGRPRGWDLHDNDRTCGTNVWSNNTWSSVGVKPACISAGGNGPVPSPSTPGSQPGVAAPNAAIPTTADPTATFPNAQAWEAFLERGRG